MTIMISQMNNPEEILSIARDDQRILADSEEKRQRIRSWLYEKGFGSLIIARRENFAWLSTGGDAAVVNSTQNSIGCLLITRDKQYLISHVMDGIRLMEEQLPGQNYELVDLHWYEGEPIDKALELASTNMVADISIPGIKNVFSDILDLHYPMTDFEIGRIRWLGTALHSVFVKMTDFIRAGIRETEIAAEFQYQQSILGISSDVLITGSDDRIFRYRHPMPTGKIIEKYIMLHSASRMWGLHAPVTRLYSIGEPEDYFSRPFKAVAEIQARVFDCLKLGESYMKILENLKNWYSETGYKDEWRNHFQGGPTGYVIVDAVRCLTQKTIQINTPFEWFITVPGSKTAELALLGAEGLEIASNGDLWPQYSVKLNGVEYKMPGIYII